MKTEKPIHKTNMQTQENHEETARPDDKQNATPQATPATACDSPQNPLSESPTNLLESYQQLRELDGELAENKDDALPAGDEPAQREEHP